MCRKRESKRCKGKRAKGEGQEKGKVRWTKEKGKREKGKGQRAKEKAKSEKGKGKREKRKGKRENSRDLKGK